MEDLLYATDIAGEISEKETEETGLWSGIFIIPNIYSICADTNTAGTLTKWFKQNMIYYSIPMHKQKAFKNVSCHLVDLTKSEKLCDRVLSLPIHPYLMETEVIKVCEVIKDFYGFNK